MTPILWDEGLAGLAREALRRSVELGVPDAEAALSVVDARQGRSGVARAIVGHLAAQQIRHAEAEARVSEVARARLTQTPPEWN